MSGAEVSINVSLEGTVLFEAGSAASTYKPVCYFDSPLAILFLFNEFLLFQASDDGFNNPSVVLGAISRALCENSFHSSSLEQELAAFEPISFESRL
jgi:hypothetical protein